MSKDKDGYWNGTKNKIIRYYFYVQKGVEEVIKFRHIIVGIVGIYIALKFGKMYLMPLMFIVVLPILGMIGWYVVHHTQKVMEYLNIEFSTYWGRRQFYLKEKQIKLQEKQIKLLEEINEKLKIKENN